MRVSTRQNELCLNKRKDSNSSNSMFNKSAVTMQQLSKNPNAYDLRESLLRSSYIINAENTGNKKIFKSEL